MPNSSRRTFLSAAGASTAAVGAAALLPAGAADAAEPKGPAHPGPLIAHVRDTSTGEIAVYVGEHEVVVHDKTLAHRIASLAPTTR